MRVYINIYMYIYRRECGHNVARLRDPLRVTSGHEQRGETYSVLYTLYTLQSQLYTT